MNYGMGESEMLAIVEACKQWRHYVEGATHRVVVIIDHANLQRFLVDKTLNRREARWWERLSGLDLVIEYRPRRLNPADAPSRRPNYEDHARKLGEATWIKQDTTSDIASLTFLALADDMDVILEGVLCEKQKIRPWVFLLVGNENNQGDIIAHTTLQAAASGESAYKEVPLTMQTAIKALQEVDSLTIRRRAAIIKSNKISTSLSDSTKAHVGFSNLKQPNVVDDSDSPTKAHLGVSNLKQPNDVDDSDSTLSSLSSSEDLSDPEESK